jgi:surface antigen
MKYTKKDIKNNTIFLVPNNESLKVEISTNNGKPYYFLRYMDIDNYHYLTYCTPFVDDIVKSINRYFTTLRP